MVFPVTDWPNQPTKTCARIVCTCQHLRSGTTRWLLPLLPCQRTHQHLQTNLTLSAVWCHALRTPLSPYAWVAPPWPKTPCKSLRGNSSLQITSPDSPLWEPSPHRHGHHTSRCLHLSRADLAGQKGEEGTKLLRAAPLVQHRHLLRSAGRASISPSLSSSSSVPLCSFRRLDGPTSVRGNPTLYFFYIFLLKCLLAQHPHTAPLSKYSVCPTHQDTPFHSRNTWVGTVSSSSLHTAFLILVWPGKLILFVLGSAPKQKHQNKHQVYYNDFGFLDIFQDSAFLLVH